MKKLLALALAILSSSLLIGTQNASAGTFKRDDPSCRTHCSAAERATNSCRDFRRSDGSCYQVFGAGQVNSTKVPSDLSCQTCPHQCSTDARANGCHDFRDSRTNQCCTFNVTGTITPPVINTTDRNLSCSTCPHRCSSVERAAGCQDFRNSSTGQCCKSK